MARILLVEDDRDLSATVESWLTSEHHNVVCAYDGDEAEQRMKYDAFDVIVLDWDLPVMSGVELLKRFRSNKGMTPIIMLTAKGSISDREKGLDSGSDDYLTKPFSLKELSARIRALLRRPSQVVSDVLTVGNISLDPVKHRVTRNGVEVQLLPRDFSLLEFFMRNVDVVFSSDALLQRVWEDDSDATSDALRTSIKRLRKKLDDSEDEGTSFLETIPRVGYRMKAGG
jgi:DNA-binding response OmpR family regulator